MQEIPDLDLHLERIKKEQEKFLKYLKTITVPSRNSILQQDFDDRLKEHSPWISYTSNQDEQKKDLSFQHGKSIDIAGQIEQLIDMIKKSPSQSADLINHFLLNFPAINETDRRVLSENFRNLDSSTLQKELLSLCQVFCVD
jgi:hypothetical protein